MPALPIAELLLKSGIMLNYEDKPGETCTDNKKFTLEIDMLKLSGTTAIIVHVANGSKVKDVSVDPVGSKALMEKYKRYHHICRERSKRKYK